MQTKKIESIPRCRRNKPKDKSCFINKNKVSQIDLDLGNFDFKEEKEHLQENRKMVK